MDLLDGLVADKVNLGLPIATRNMLKTGPGRCIAKRDIRNQAIRAEDVLAALVFEASDTIDLKVGYRILEGGADNDEVYNFTLINYASIGAIFRF